MTGSSALVVQLNQLKEENAALAERCQKVEARVAELESEFEDERKFIELLETEAGVPCRGSVGSELVSWVRAIKLDLQAAQGAAIEIAKAKSEQWIELLKTRSDLQAEKARLDWLSDYLIANDNLLCFWGSSQSVPRLWAVSKTLGPALIAKPSLREAIDAAAMNLTTYPETTTKVAEQIIASEQQSGAAEGEKGVLVTDVGKTIQGLDSKE